MPQAEGEGISPRIKADASLPVEVSIDADKITWALTTLVGNAHRSLRRGGATLPHDNGSPCRDKGSQGL